MTPHLATTPFHIFSKLALSESQTEVLAADQESNQAYEIICGSLYLALDADPEEPDCMVLHPMIIVQVQGVQRGSWKRELWVII